MTRDAAARKRENWRRHRGTVRAINGSLSRRNAAMLQMHWTHMRVRRERRLWSTIVYALILEWRFFEICASAAKASITVLRLRDIYGFRGKSLSDPDRRHDASYLSSCLNK